MPTWALILFLSALWGSNFMAIKIALRHTTPLVLGAGRSGLGGLLMVALVRAFGAPFPRRRADLRAMLLISLFMPTLFSVGLLLGVARIPAGLASLLINTMPLFAVALSWAMVGERASARAATGLAVGFAGTGLVALPALRGETNPVGVVLVLGAACSWALGSILVKRHRLPHIHPLMSLGLELAISGVLLGLIALIFEPLSATRINGEFLVAFSWVTLAPSALGLAIWIEIVGRTTVARASATAYLVPLFGVLFGVLFLHEVLRPVEAVGAVLVLAGVGIGSTRAHGAPREEAPREARMGDAAVSPGALGPE